MSSSSSQKIPTSSANSTPTPTVFDVLLSFSGKDTRTGFTSHLYNALCRNTIRTFMDDPELDSGEVITPRLIQAIQESKISILVLSENYASSSWCLDELVEIVKCFKEWGRLVIPIFYKIDPSVVRHQIGSFKTAFDKHNIRFATEMGRVKKWRDALSQVADLSGYHFSENRDHAERLCAAVKELAKSSTSDSMTLRNKVDKLCTAIAELSMSSECDIRVFRNEVDILCCALREMESSSDNSISNFREQVESLHAAVKINGHEHRECGNRHTRSEADICNEVIDRVLLKIKPTTMEITKYPIRLASRVDYIKSLLDTDGVSTIGIWGMGGIGKTTLAKAVFNEISPSFPGSSFLEDVSKVSGTVNGLVSLQQQLIDEVLKKKIYTVSSVSHGTATIKKRICSIKVLIILDDLDDLDQFEPFAGPFLSGSVIIITTRKEDLLNTIGVEPKNRYMLHTLDSADSWDLFKQHAFQDKEPSDTLMDLSKEILQHVGGLPYALELIGSNLRYQSEGEWKRFVGRLKEAPNQKIHQKLIISFDALLDDILKEMFLDIACFFLGEYRTNVVPILGSYYRDVEANIDRLKSRCLITFGKYNSFSMHDLHRDMGWEIARRNYSKNEPEKHTRLFRWEDIFNVLKNEKGTEAITGIVHHDNDKSSGETFHTQSLQRMPKLRFLKLQDVNFTGSFGQIFEELRWLEWWNCPLESLLPDFFPKELVILVLKSSKIKKWELTKELSNLKILDLYRCDELITTPDFSKLPCLESIILRECSQLENVDPTIGSLVNLVSLDLDSCSSLRSLPDSVCNLKALKSLDVGHCISLKALPEEFGNIKSLITLNGRVLRISELPNSMGRLSKLVELRLGYNENLLTLPDTIGNMTSLEILEISCCKKLNISQLPDLQLPPNLIKLWASHCSSMLRSPNLSNLKQLEHLDLQGWSRLEEIKGLEELTSIEDLLLDGCISIKRLPNLSNFKQLERLILTNCSSLIEIKGLEELIFIRDLYLGGCISIKRLPNLSNMKRLETLILTNCRSLKEIEGLEGLASIIQLELVGCDSTMVAKTLTLSLLQTYSEFRNETEIQLNTEATPDCISHSDSGYTEVRIDVSRKFLGLLLSVACCSACVNRPTYNIYPYTVKNRTSGSTYAKSINDNIERDYGPGERVMVFVGIKHLIELCGRPDEDTILDVSADCMWHEEKANIGVHPLYTV